MFSKWQGLQRFSYYEYISDLIWVLLTIILYRVIESTLRSINNLLERFHQSFFFYLMPSSNHYVSIGNYMPAFGLICLPLLIQMIKIWCSIFMEDANDRKEAASKDFKQNFFWFAIPNVFISLAFGIVLEFG